jgi:hypothetical protein
MKNWIYYGVFFLFLILIGVVCLSLPLGIEPGSQYSRDIVVVKLAEDGSPVWTKVVDSGGDDFPAQWMPLPDGGVVILDHTGHLIRLSGKGEIQWILDKDQAYVCKSLTVMQTRDGGFLTTGDEAVCRFDPSGKSVWLKTSLAFNAITPRLETEDGGFVVIANKIRNDSAIVQAVDSTGNFTRQEIKWNSTFLNPNSLWGSKDFEVDIPAIIKLDQSGNTTWQKNFTNHEFSQITSVTALHDLQGFSVRGEFPNTALNKTQFREIQLSRDGSVINSTMSDSPSPSEVNDKMGIPIVYGKGSILTTRDGGCLVVVRSGSKIRDNILSAQKFSSTGKKEWDSTVTSVSINGGIVDYAQTPDGGYVVIGINDPKTRGS